MSRCVRDLMSPTVRLPAEGFAAVTMSAPARTYEVKTASRRSGSDALLAFASAYRDYAHQHPGRYAATRHPLPPHLMAAGRAHAELTFAVLRGYGLSGDDAIHAARLIGSVLHGFADLELSGSFSHSDPPSEESWQRVIHALDATLTRWERE